MKSTYTFLWAFLLAAQTLTAVDLDAMQEHKKPYSNDLDTESDLTVSDKHGGGAMSYHKEEIRLRRGVYHIVVDSGRSIINDTHKIMKDYNDLWEYCKNLHAGQLSHTCPSMMSMLLARAKGNVDKMQAATGINVSSIVDYYTSAIRFRWNIAEWRLIHDSDFVIASETPINAKPIIAPKLKHRKKRETTKRNLQDTAKEILEDPVLIHDEAYVPQKSEIAFEDFMLAMKIAFPMTIGRMKRDGAFWIFMKWMFFLKVGKDAEMTQPRSAGEMSHALESVEKVAKEVSANEKAIEEEIRRMRNKMMNANSYSNQMELDMIIMRAVMLAGFASDSIAEIYSGHPLPSQEIDHLKMKVNNEVATSDAVVPELPDSELWSIIDHSLVQLDTLKLMLGFPLVSKTTFYRMAIFPMPDIVNNKMMNFTMIDVAIDFRNLLFFYPAEHTIEKIGLNYHIAEVKTLYRITSESPCVLRMITLPNVECPTISIPPDFEQFVETPVTNTFQFFSREKKTLLCPDSRTEIDSYAGVVVIPQRCSLTTETRLISTTLDKTKITGNVALISFDSSVMFGNNLTKTAARTTSFTTSTTRKPIVSEIKTDEIEKEIAYFDHVEAVGEHIGNHHMRYIVVILIFVIAFGFYWVKKNMGKMIFPVAEPPSVAIEMVNIPDPFELDMNGTPTGSIHRDHAPPMPHARFRSTLHI